MTSTAGIGTREALRSAGEVGHDLLEVDWSGTALGEPEAWPRSLVTIVRTLLTSRFSMWMAWGPELTFFCNAAYRRDTLGEKYPWALGQPASEVWAEIWPEIGPRIETVMSTGQATWDEALMLFLERSGYTEETYHTFSYSPLPDDESRVAGMLCVVSEETERVIGDRRMALLRDLGAVPATVGDEHAFLQAAARQLARSNRSLPFTAAYLFDDHGAAQLVARTGFTTTHPLLPDRLGASVSAPWPVAALLAGGSELIEDLPVRYERLPTGAWERPPQCALAVPLARATHGRSYGFLVAGLNPFRRLDGEYRSFVELIAQRLAAGIAGARSLDVERRRAEQLAELDRDRTAFFSNVSHELRTPLTLMLAPMEDALHEDEGLHSEQLQLVHRNTLRLLKLVNGLLDFSRVEAGRMRATFRPTDLAALTEELAGTFQDAARRAEIELVVHCEQLADGQVYVDPDMWERITLNLLSNAFKVTLSGQIIVRLRTVGQTVELSVADTGPGIPADQQGRLFERFYRVDNPTARSHEGAGIGLALVKELVELHGGAVGVRSELGRGTTFTVEVPLGAEHLPATQIAEDAGERTPAFAALFLEEVLSWGTESGGEVPGPEGLNAAKAYRVLVADDNPDLRRYVTRVLESFFEVEAVGDGMAALERIRSDPPNLLLTDVMMPRMDGYELLKAIRTEPATQDLPVVMLSARAGEEASIEGLRAGADDYLAKPFTGRELLARVTARVELAETRRRATAEVLIERHRLEETLRQLPAGVALAEAPSGRILMMNEQVSKILGYSAAGAASVADYSGHGTFTLAGEPVPVDRLALTRAVRDGEVTVDEDMLYVGATGRRIVVRSNAGPIRDQDGEVVAAVSVFQDVTERVRSRQLLASQRDILADIASSRPLAQVLERIALDVEELSEFRPRVSILLRSTDGLRLEHGAAPSLPAAYNEAIDGIEIGPGVGSCGSAAYREETVVVTDIAADPLWNEFRELANRHGLGACWSTPVFATDGELVATFAVYHDHVYEPTEADQRLVELMARTTAVAIERARDARAQARQLAELQSSLLPRVLPELPGIDIAVRFHAGDLGLNVGGDFYDVFALKDGAWGFVIGDVCGHGAEAAAVTALTRHTIRAVARLGHDPSQVLTVLNDSLLHSEYERFCTAIFGRLEPGPEGIRVRLASGGHLPPLIRCRDGSVQKLSEHGPLLGVFAESEFPEMSVTLGPGDALVLYTDGLVERNSRRVDEERLPEVLAELAASTAEELLSVLERAVLGPAPRQLRDDVAVLVLQAEASG